MRNAVRNGDTIAEPRIRHLMDCLTITRFLWMQSIHWFPYEATAGVKPT